MSAFLPVAKGKRSLSIFQHAVDTGLSSVDDYPQLSKLILTTGSIADNHITKYDEVKNIVEGTVKGQFYKFQDPSEEVFYLSRELRLIFSQDKEGKL